MSHKFKNYTTEELEAEVNRRKNMPKMIVDPNWDGLMDYVEESLDQVSRGDGFPKDFEHWIYENVMETLYGTDIWAWLNSRKS